MSAACTSLPHASTQKASVLDESLPATPSVGGTWQHPPSFICPISQQVMHDPVVVSDGHTYERRHIERWLQKHTTSPVTNEHLREKTLFPNHALRNAISEYFDQVFSAQRGAIRKSIRNHGDQQRFSSNEALLHTIDTLLQCSFLVNADLNTVSVLQEIIKEARNLVGAHAASVFLVDESTHELYSKVNSTGKEIRIPMGSGIAGHVASTGEPLIIADAYADERFNRSNDMKTGYRTHNILCVPLKAKKGAVIGVVQLINKTVDGVFGRSHRLQASEEGEYDCDENFPAFTSQDLQFLQVFASQAALAVINSGGIIAEQGDNKQEELREDCEHSLGLKKLSYHEAQPEFDILAYDWPVSNGVRTRISSWADESQDLQMASISSLGSFAGSDDERRVKHCKIVAILESAASFALGQARFFENVVRPLFLSLVQAVPSAKPMLEVVMTTYGPLDGVRDLEVHQKGQEEDRMMRKKSGRSRQRAARYWARARCRTPSPEPSHYRDPCYAVQH